MLSTEIVAQATTQDNTVIASDLLPHIEDTPLFWVFRHGRHEQLTWNELTETERAWTEESERRAAYTAMFDPNYCA